MFLEFRKCRTTNDVWADAFSWWRNQLFFFYLSGRLRRIPSLSRSKTHSKTCHWRLDQGVWIPCGQCLGCRKKRSTWTWRFCEIDALFSAAVNLALPLRRLLLSLRVITIHPCFITGYDIGDEVGVVSGLLFEFPANRYAKGLLVVAQQSWHKSRRNASHVQIVRQNALNGPLWQSYYLTNIVDSLPTICKDSLANFCYVFRYCVCRRSSRTLIVVEKCSSVLESFVP